MSLVAATEGEYTTFRTKYGRTIADGEEAFLPLSFAFLSTLPFCAGDAVEQTAAITEAQCFIAYAMSANGGGFDPTLMGDAKTLIKKNLGRSAIVKEYEINAQLVGTDPMSMLRKIPMALALLDSVLCPVPVAGESAAGVFVV